jgi:hypothetical protein
LLRDPGIVGSTAVEGRRLAALGKGQQTVVDQVVAALKARAHVDRPGDRHHIERQEIGDLVEQLEGVAPLPVHLVDESDDRHVAQAADLEELAGLGLDALGRIQHHDRRIDRGQGAVGVLTEVLVTRGVQEVEGEALVLEGHDRGGHRDTPGLLDLHPVGTGAPPLPAGPDRPGHADRPAQKQKLFGQGGFAGVRVGDDRKGPPPAGGLGRGVQGRRFLSGKGHGRRYSTAVRRPIGSAPID